jgi:CDP-paratose 2-epimerase
VSDVSKFQSHFPEWKLSYNIPAILREIHAAQRERGAAALATT